MPYLGGINLSERTYNQVIRDIGDNRVISARIEENNFLNLNQLRVQTRNDRDIPQTFIFGNPEIEFTQPIVYPQPRLGNPYIDTPTTPAPEPVRAREVDPFAQYAAITTPIPENLDGVYPVQGFPTGWGEIPVRDTRGQHGVTFVNNETYTIANQWIDTPTEYHTPTIRFNETLKKLKRMTYAELEVEAKKEEEEFMKQAAITPSKTYKDFIKVDYVKSRNAFNITIYDLFTKEAIATQGLTSPKQFYLHMHDDLERYYENNIPSLVRDTVAAPRKYSEFDTPPRIFNNLKTFFIEKEARLEETVKSVMYSIQGSNPDDINYWLDLQTKLYKFTVAHEACKKLNKFIKENANLTELEVPLMLLYMLNITRMSDLKLDAPTTTLRRFELGSSSSKYAKLHYKLSEALTTPSKEIKFKFPGEETISIYKDFMIFKVKEEVNEPVTALTEEQLIPHLNSLYTDLNNYLKQLNKGRYSLLMEDTDSIYGYYYNGEMDRGYFSKVFTIFNDIKNSLMFTGMSEEAATQKVVQNSDLHDIPKANNFKYCHVTKQYLPQVFLSTHSNGNPISTYYMTQSLMKYKFDNMSKTAMELPLSRDEEYTTTVKNHSKNVLECLSIRKEDDENTTITSKDSLYNPTPFMGIELEVQQQDAKVYTIDDKKCFAPDDIISQCYNSLGRDYVLFKQDGSLRGTNPFEIVTVPATLRYHKNRWNSFLNNKDLKKYLTSFSNGNCGMHVHISRDSFTGLHLAKFMRFINCAENNKFVTDIAQRSGPGQNGTDYAVYSTTKKTGQFAGFVKDENGNVKQDRDMLRNTTKYSAVNTAPRNTIEVRIFKGNLAKVGFLKNLEFVHAVWAYTKDAPLTSLDFNSFMFWLFNPELNTKDYGNLKLWLVNAGWNVSGVNISKTITGVKKRKLEEHRDKVTKAREILKKKFIIAVDKLPTKEGAPAPIPREEISSVA